MSGELGVGLDGGEAGKAGFEAGTAEGEVGAAGFKAGLASFRVSGRVDKGFSAALRRLSKMARIESVTAFTRSTG